MTLPPGCDLEQEQLSSGVKPKGEDILAALRHGRWNLAFLLLEYNAELLRATFPSEREAMLLHLAMLPPDLAAARRHCTVWWR